MMSIFSDKNWEHGISRVEVQTCHESDDPTGYKAVFYLKHAHAKVMQKDSFAVGASYLKKRLENLTRAGYNAPMTDKALELLNSRLISVAA